MHAQAVLVLRWFKERTDLRMLARDAQISVATAYRYLHEGIDVIAAHNPDLPEVLARGIEQGWPFVCLDGTLIATDRCRAGSENGHDAWYSGKHKRHGGNVQVVCGPDGYPEWVPAVEPGSRHDIVCARLHALPALYAAAGKNLPTLTDKGYTGAGAGVMVSAKGRDLAPDTETRNQIIAALRAPAERGNALLKQTWKALQHVSLDPNRITQVTALDSSSFTCTRKSMNHSGEKTSMGALRWTPTVRSKESRGDPAQDLCSDGFGGVAVGFFSVIANSRGDMR